MADLKARTRWEPSEAEAEIFERWEASGLFDPPAQGSAQENYSIAIPPPNVTGALHMGHALNGTIQDCLIRYHRMRGRRTRWTLGTDHAGIATQRQVEKLLEAEGTSRKEIGRAAFIERVWEWRERYGGTIVGQLKRLGASLDYADERFTLDESYARAVAQVFVDLYDRGLIYRDNFMVNWDPGMQSAISDIEVEDREVTDTLYEISYSLADDPKATVVVATVRPETLFGDCAIAVHPDDERYSHLVGRAAILPLVGRRLPIIADEYVKQDFGTGALKITPGHDPNDFEIGRKHGLAEIGVIEPDGSIGGAAPEAYKGKSAAAARAAVVEALRAEGRIVSERDYTHSVPFSHRSGERIEPLISLQWFMRMDELAAPAITAANDGSLRIHPDNQRKRFVAWLENIKPWCVSRQLWWGHQIPVYYRGDETYVGSEPPGGEGWERDPDVLDTWFSSALWPFATLGWPDQTPQLAAYYPTDALSTGRDILFLWVARMVMFGIDLTGELPFSDVYNHSTILAADGRRMSKSLGTGVDPLEIIDRYGADGTRFGLLAMSSTQDVRFSEEKIAQGRQLANKLFNATRLVLMRTPRGLEDRPASPATVEDAWILSRLQRVGAATADSIESFEFHRAALGLYDFVYGELCDWYLEIVKPRLYDEEDEQAGPFALAVIADTLAIAHPVIPFVTEELWSTLGEGLLMGYAWPAADSAAVDPEAEAEIERAIVAVSELRGWRDRVGAPAGATIPARLQADGYERTAAHVARLARVEWSDRKGEPTVTLAVPGGTIELLASDAVDSEAQRRRVDERRAWLASEIDRAQARLANEGFTSKAPAQVVGAEREKLERLQSELGGL